MKKNRKVKLKAIKEYLEIALIISGTVYNILSALVAFTVLYNFFN